MAISRLFACTSQKELRLNSSTIYMFFARGRLAMKLDFTFDRLLAFSWPALIFTKLFVLCTFGTGGRRWQPMVPKVITLIPFRLFPLASFNHRVTF